MKKNKILLVIIICILAYAVFVIITLTLFNSVRNDPINNLSITYIRTESDIEKEYGRIISVARNHLYDTQENESMIKVPYAIETETGRVMVYVTLTKCNGEWKANSLEVIEVEPNE